MKFQPVYYTRMLAIGDRIRKGLRREHHLVVRHTKREHYKHGYENVVVAQCTTSRAAQSAFRLLSGECER